MYSLHVKVVEMPTKSECSFNEYLLISYMFRALEYETDSSAVFTQPHLAGGDREQTSK